MEFDNYTRKYLKRILKDLDFEATGYEWGTEEFEFLNGLCATIEDALRGRRQGKLVQEHEDVSALSETKRGVGGFGSTGR